MYCMPITSFLASGKFITVGWGKKETQFHGTEGKAAAVRKLMVSVMTKSSTSSHCFCFLLNEDMNSLGGQYLNLFYCLDRFSRESGKFCHSLRG